MIPLMRGPNTSKVDDEGQDKSFIEVEQSKRGHVSCASDDKTRQFRNLTRNCIYVRVTRVIFTESNTK